MGPLSYMRSIDRNVAIGHIPVRIHNNFIFACVYNYLISVYVSSNQELTL